MQTDNKTYIEPENWEGTKGDWNKKYISDLIKDRFDMPYGELIANLNLLSQSKELLKALQNIVTLLEMSGNMSVAAKEYYHDAVTKANEVIDKSLNKPTRTHSEDDYRKYLK